MPIEEPGILDLADAFSRYEDTNSPSAQAALQGLKSKYVGQDPTTQEGAEGAQRGLSSLYSPSDPMEEKPGFWGTLKKELLSPQMIGAGLNLGVGGILHMAGAGKVGDAFMMGSSINSEQYLRQKQEEQKNKLEMRQQAWKDAYEQAKELPEEFLLANPELAASVQAFQKDMADNGQVDNEKTLTEFLKQMALHNKRFGDFQAESETARNRKAAEEKSAMEQEIQMQQISKAQQILQDENSSEADKIWAMGITQPENQPVWDKDEGRYLSPQERLQRDQMAQSMKQHEDRLDIEAQQLGLNRQRLQTEREQLEIARQYGGASAAAGVLGDMVTQSLKEAAQNIDAQYEGEEDPGKRAAILQEAKADTYSALAPYILSTAVDLGLLKKAPDGSLIAPDGQPVGILSPQEAMQLSASATAINRNAAQIQERFPGMDFTLSESEFVKVYGKTPGAVEAYRIVGDLRTQSIEIENQLEARAARLEHLFSRINSTGVQAQVGMRLAR